MKLIILTHNYVLHFGMRVCGTYAAVGLKTLCQHNLDHYHMDLPVGVMQMISQRCNLSQCLIFERAKCF